MARAVRSAREMQHISAYTQNFDTDREYVSNFGAEGGLPELARIVDLTIDRMLPDVPGTEDDAVRALLKKRLLADVLNPQWVAPETGPELRWMVAVRGSAAARRKSTIELVRQYAVGMSECAFALTDVPVVSTVRAGVIVEAACTPLGYAPAARAGKPRAAEGGAASERRRRAYEAWKVEIEAYRTKVLESGSVLDAEGKPWPAPVWLTKDDGDELTATAGRARSFNVQWAARIRISIGPFTVTTREVLRDLLYTVRTP
jgi:hypothetical protein